MRRWREGSPKQVFGFAVSIGVAEFATDDRDWSGALRRADQALYRAKDQGRNRIVASHVDDAASGRRADG